MVRKPQFTGSTVIGCTGIGLKQPILFDIHRAIALNKPPVTLITGSPGSGKTFLAEVITGQASVMGKLGFVIDPKGDFTQLKYLYKRGLIGKTKIWSLFEDQANAEISKDSRGMLDPMTLTGDRQRNVSITIDLIRTLYGKKLTDIQSNKLTPILQDVSEGNQPTLRHAIKVLRSSQDESVRNLGVELNRIAALPISQLLISDKPNKNPFMDSEGLLIISLAGMSIPAQGVRVEDASDEQRISIAIMSLITLCVLEAMSKQPKHIQKFVVIDEAWMVKNTEAGRRLMNQASLLGRSMNMAVVLATQSPQHIQPSIDQTESDALDNTISTRFAFRNSSLKDNQITSDSMKLPKGEEWESIFAELMTGNCIMRDCESNIALVQVIADKTWETAFDNNPTTHGKNDKKSKEEVK